MSKSLVLSIEQFKSVLSGLHAPEKVDADYLYDVYETAASGLNDMVENNVFGNIVGVNHVVLINYCLGEYLYSTALIQDEEGLKKFKENENIVSSMASVVADKYLSLSHLYYQERKLTNPYYPPISTMSLYVNFMLSILNRYEKNDPGVTLVTDLLIKSLTIAKCTLDNLVGGFETEALSNWRTLHECECTLVLLEKYKDPVIKRYLRHMNFGIVYKDVLPDKDKQHQIFEEMKEEMRGYNLKSKDIKKYIEYGWMYEIEEFKNDESYKLNFRDGLEKLAGLSKYASRYELSSEIIHSTPMLIYSNKEYYYFLALLSLYESFFRLEKVFITLFTERVNEEQKKGYAQMRNLYYAQLVNIYKIESSKFKAWQINKRKRSAK